MSDNISRQAALAYPLSWEHYDMEHGDRKFICGVESYREYIEHLPSTDRTGHWVRDKQGHVFCSECGTVDELNYLTGNYMYSNFCAECGADMRGEQNE